ncbi:hypothetical protein NECAME_00462 [Necator americanus]|uniref:Uncharacterized protein n=1 Tax=Necator americanus TaxID=51031 RepID=W2T7G3_NECAM|nr:hypothetical protein NECAME_00462 [Necator americanus]ETN76937.1 hypothetical protein NECAME_00462 [Necator americanus]
MYSPVPLRGLRPNLDKIIDLAALSEHCFGALLKSTHFLPAPAEKIHQKDESWEEVFREERCRQLIMAWLQPEPMEPIPEEGNEDAGEWTLSPTSSGRRTTRKREIFTSEQVDTLVRSAQCE